MEKDSKKKVSFRDSVEVRTIERNQMRSEMDEDEEDNAKKRNRDDDDEEDDEEANKQARIQAEKSRRKKRKLLAGVEDDSENSGEGYEGEERPDDEVKFLIPYMTKLV